MRKDRSKTDAIENLLQDIGFPTNIKGYPYLTHAILLISTDEKNLNSLNDNLYSKIAEEYNTTAGAVERAIRHAISTTWLRGNLELQQKLFRYTVDPEKGKPTNSEFLSLISNIIRKDYQ